jgi:hypothetical protein
VWQAEYDRQLKRQQAAINNMDVATWREHRQRFEDEGRDPKSSGEQERYRIDFEEKMRLRVKAELLEKYLDEGMEEDAANKKANIETGKRVARFMRENVALHEPDQVAGGSPEAVHEMGLRRVNSSIGSQWKRLAPTLTAAVDAWINGGGLKVDNMNVELTRNG